MKEVIMIDMKGPMICTTREEDPHRGGRGGYFPRGGYNGPMHHDRHAEGGRGANESSDGTQPAMMSFKTFLGTQDDTISDEEAIKKYAEFKLKYHPEDSSKRKEEQKTALNCRVEVFNKFLK